MFTRLHQDITTRGHRLHQEMTRTRRQLRQARDEYRLAKAERPRGVARLTDLVTRCYGVTLYRDRIERGREVHSLAGVRCSVSESSTDPVTPSDGGAIVAVVSSRKVRGFAALVNSYATAIPAPRSSFATATATGQFRVLDELRARGVLTDEEFGTAVSRLRGARYG
jgi:hypothetical protein